MKNFLTDCLAGVKSIWQHYWLGIVVIFGTIIALGYHQIMIDFLVNAANKSFGVANKKADALSKIEEADKVKAGVAIQAATAAQAQEKAEVVNPDWNQK